jgi:MFS transporter, FHS family, L-fucose permease
MSKSKISLKIVAPVLLSYFVMSFCDLVGIGVDRVKLDFGLSNTLVQLIPSAVFLWFFILSVPTGILQDRIGKRKVLNLGMVLTAVGLAIPLAFYSFTWVLIAFGLLGIGNTIVQVSSNPLLFDVVRDNRRASFLSFSQFIKSIGSMIAAPLAGFFASRFGNWKIVLLVFGVVSLLSVLWLSLTPVEETRNTEKRAGFASSFSLLGNGFIALMVTGIFLVVGIDVGINAFSGQFLLSKFGSAQTFAESGRSVYFFGKMLGTFGGALILTLLPSRKFFLWSSILGLISLIALVFATSEMSAMIIIFFIGLGIANIFPLIFTLSVEKFPLRANEISGLMVMAISGGAIVPVIIGFLTDIYSVTAGMMVLVASICFILSLSVYVLLKAKKKEAI